MCSFDLLSNNREIWKFCDADSSVFQAEPCKWALFCFSQSVLYLEGKLDQLIIRLLLLGASWRRPDRHDRWTKSRESRQTSSTQFFDLVPSHPFFLQPLFNLDQYLLPFWTFLHLRLVSYPYFQLHSLLMPRPHRHCSDSSFSYAIWPPPIDYTKHSTHSCQY